jgi:hypothetical protein
VVLLFNWLDWWAPVYRWFGLLRLHLNLGAYLAVAVPLSLMWAVTVFFFDRRTYLSCSAGQVHIRDELGETEKVCGQRRARECANLAHGVCGSVHAPLPAGSAFRVPFRGDPQSR